MSEDVQLRPPVSALTLGLVCDIADGRIASWLGFFNHADALEAAGG